MIGNQKIPEVRGLTFLMARAVREVRAIRGRLPGARGE